MLWRAMTLRCPHCGGRRILTNWFHLKDRCPRCGLHLHREETDYFLGAYMVALFIMEGFFAAGFVIVLVITWPSPPWDAIQYGGALLLVLGILAAYPFANTLWLAIDLIFRPVSSTELRWYEGDSAVQDTPVSADRLKD